MVEWERIPQRGGEFRLVGEMGTISARSRRTETNPNGPTVARVEAPCEACGGDGCCRERGYQMKYGARNTVVGEVKSVQKGDIMSLVKFDVAPCEMASVLTTESLEEMGLAVGDRVSLVVKAVNVLPVKE